MCSIIVSTKYLWFIDIAVIILAYLFYKSAISIFNKKQLLYQYAAQDKPSLFSQSEKRYFYETSSNIFKLTKLFRKWLIIILSMIVIAIIFSH